MVEKNMSASALTSLFSRLLGEKASPIETLINYLGEFENIELFTPFKERIAEILTILQALKESKDPKITQYLELPLKYLKKYYEQYEDHLKNNPDIALVMFQETINNLKLYIESTNNIVQDLIIAEQSPIIKVNGDNQCTLDKFGCKLAKQKAFNCIDCGLTGSKIICEACAAQCHAGHKLKSRGNVPAFCDCRLLTSNCLLEENCSFEITGETFVPQKKYICTTCSMKGNGSDMLCHFCITECHQGHIIQSLGEVKGFCDCRTLFDFCKRKKVRE